MGSGKMTAKLVLSTLLLAVIGLANMYTLYKFINDVNGYTGLTLFVTFAALVILVYEFTTDMLDVSRNIKVPVRKKTGLGCKHCL